VIMPARHAPPRSSPPAPPTPSWLPSPRRCGSLPTPRTNSPRALW